MEQPSFYMCWSLRSILSGQRVLQLKKEPHTQKHCKQFTSWFLSPFFCISLTHHRPTYTNISYPSDPEWVRVRAGGGKGLGEEKEERALLFKFLVRCQHSTEGEDALTGRWKAFEQLQRWGSMWTKFVFRSTCQCQCHFRTGGAPLPHVLFVLA